MKLFKTNRKIQQKYPVELQLTTKRLALRPLPINDVCLAQGARQVFVITNHRTKKGELKIVKECTYPLTGAGVVTVVFTDLAVIDVTAKGLEVRELVEDLSFEELQQRTGASLSPSPDIRPLTAPLDP